MGPDFNAHAPELSYSTRIEGGESLSLCTPCHDNQIEEWTESGHGSAQGGDIDAYNDEHFAHVGSCQPCHTSEGFIWANDAAYSDREIPHVISFIGCVTCHDPHMGEASAEGNPSQLRNISPVEVAYHPGLDPGDIGVPVMEGYGTAQTCAQCHHARRGSTSGTPSGPGSDVEEQIAFGYDHFGPHESPQMDMFIGNGCYEIPDFDYEDARESTHQTLDKACVDCHMRISTDASAHRVHDFEPTVEVNCSGCHPGATDFNVDEGQDAIVDLMDQVAAALGLGYTTAQDLFDAWGAADPHGSISIATEAWQREAAYAVYFVSSDGSKGVHNPAYARALLENALAHAQAQGGGLAAR
jgi:formate-dependent nitrite reductase cytochrome c552 subunit